MKFVKIEFLAKMINFGLGVTFSKGPRSALPESPVLGPDFIKYAGIKHLEYYSKSFHLLFKRYGNIHIKKFMNTIQRKQGEILILFDGMQLF